ncbi:CoxG family protein [Pelomonas sp. KK5]|uniref:CoxG family protein n=1 Tax=Pelomonas sp. KK5 TaxID=1855730 RepID=UPI00097C48E2|nr:carbon monoxide dehydrogenase subunit G [Pelomonas sp. KK5]
MRIVNTRELPCPQQQAWAALNDEAELQACIPGCESLVRGAPDQLQAVVAAALGPVRARFRAQLSLQDLVPPQSYRVVFDGQGGVAGFGKGTAQVRLEAIDAARCRLSYEIEVQIGGKLAQIGSRVVDAAAQKIIGEFFERFEARLQPPQVPSALLADEATPPPGWWQRLRAWLALRRSAASS